MRINSLDVHRTEDLLVTAGDDDALRVYSTQSGVELNQIWSKRHGICHITYTHDPQGVVYASNKVPHDGVACRRTCILSPTCPVQSLPSVESCHVVLGTAACTLCLQAGPIMQTSLSDKHSHSSTPDACCFPPWRSRGST